MSSRTAAPIPSTNGDGDGSTTATVGVNLADASHGNAHVAPDGPARDMPTLAVPAHAATAHDTTPHDPVEAFYARADALYRCAVECCRQHERVAALDRRGALGPEQRAAQALASLCDDALDELAAGYERAATRARPARGDAAGDACWHAANGLWLAARELTRRHRTSARASKGIGEHGDRSSARLAELALDYDLEASALLLLKQAIETYRKARPGAA